MPEIIPAIIAKSFNELQEKIKIVEPYVKSVQIDVMDGVFAREKNWNEPMELKNINTNLKLEVHLMVEDVEQEIEKWVNSGVKRILAHYEAIISNSKVKNEQVPCEREQNSKSQLKIQKLIDMCRRCGVEFGIVLNLETPLEVLDQIAFIIHDSSFIIQLMSIAKIGYHGEPFDERVIPKIKALREKYSDVKISVDGGINLENARQVIDAGADVLVIGSAIFGSKDAEKTIKEFKNIIGES